MYQRGLIQGNNYRIKQLLKKLKNGKAVTYGAIGGSITEGAAASELKYKYVERVATWLRKKYPAEVDVVNAGIGASNSLFGIFRCEKDLLAFKPDLITIEYAVNDSSNPDTAASYEALVRKCLKASPNSAVILIFTMNIDGENRQHLQIPVGKHYQTPMLSYRDAVYPLIDGGKMVWTDISPDSVHPNNYGHSLITEMLCKLIAESDKSTEDIAVGIPDYLEQSAKKYANPAILDATRMHVNSQSGWTQGPHKAGYTGWQANTPGATIEIKFSGTYVALGSQQYSGDFGRVSIVLDDAPPVIVEGYFTKKKNNDWAGGHTILTIIGDNIEPGEHTLKVTLLEGKHPNSNGHKFDIGYILCS